MVFSLTRVGDSTISHSVNYATSNGTAGSGDYIATSGTITFSPAQTTVTILVSTRTDTRFEATETFFMNLSSPTGGATIGRAQGTGLLEDDGGGGCQFCRIAEPVEL